MRELEQRRHPLRVLMLRLFLAILLLIAVLLARGVWNIYQKERETYTGRYQAEEQLSSLEEREMKLRSDIARLRTSDGVEEALRHQFDMVKEGEGLIVIVDNSAEPEVPEKNSLASLSFWKRLLPLAPWKLFGQ